MDFPLSRERAVELIVLERTASTNDDLAALAGVRDEFTTVVTLDQFAGRGRLGRAWVALPGTALAASVLLHPTTDAESLGWVPLMAGLAMTRAVHALGVPDARLKWPNDVLVRGLKISGMLSELRPGGIIVGAGLNLTQSREDLPVPTATSLALEGVEGTAEELADRALAAFLGELALTWSCFRDWNGDVEASGIRASVQAQCSTIGEAVRVSLPDGSERIGTATGLDPAGHLIVREPDASELVVAAGDVTHVRNE